MDYAGLGRRVGAQALDVPIAVLSAVAPVYIIMRLLLVVGAWAPTGESYQSHQFVARLAIFNAYFLACGPIYCAVCHASPWQATFGKRLLNIHVTGDDGKRISLARSLGRELTMYLFAALMLALVSLVTIAATGKRKGLHDYVAGTCVLRGRPAPGGAIEWWRIAAALAVPAAWTLAALLLTM